MDLEEVKKTWKLGKEQTIEDMVDMFSSFREGLTDKSYYRKVWTLFQIITLIAFIVIDVYALWLAFCFLSNLF